MRRLNLAILAVGAAAMLASAPAARAEDPIGTYDGSITESAASGKPVLLEFYADW